MLSDPERIFSLTGLLYTANRVQLRPDIVRVLMAVGSWNKKGITNILDGRSKYPQKEGAGHIWQEGASTSCQDSQ